MRPPNAICDNDSQQYRHRSTQFIHDLSSCISLAMSNRLSSRRPNFWSDDRTSCGSRTGPLFNQSRNQSLPPILNSHDTYICCSYSPRCFIIQKVKPSTLQSTLCSSSNSCESTTNPIETSTIIKAKRCANHDSKQINQNSLDSEQLTKNVEIRENEFKITSDNNMNKSEINSSLNELKDKMNVCESATTHSNSVMISSNAFNNNAINEVSVVINTDDKTPDKNIDNKNANLSSPKLGIPVEELKVHLQRQLEYYFSRENLARDTYLISQMDSDQYVPISIVANFDQIKKLTDDKQLVVDVLRQSASVQVDDSGEKVRPNHKRCVLILREIPESTSSKDIEELFSGKNCPKFVCCEFAHNNSWYVTFETDEDAQRAYRYIREEIKIFPATGKPIMARIKAKPIVHSIVGYNKTGFRPTVGVSTASSCANSISNTSTETFSSNSQPLQNFTYANVPTVNFNSRIYPPFYPPSMLQAWTPNTNAYYDLSAVFVANGLAPHTYGSTGRHNYHSSKNVRNNHNSKPHSTRKTHFHTNSNNFNTSSLSVNSNMSNSGGVTPTSTNGTSVSSTADSFANNSRYNAKHYSNSKSSIANNNSGAESSGLSNSNSSGAVADAVDVVIVTPFVSTKTGTSAQSNLSSKSHLSQSVDNSAESYRSNSPLNAQRSKGRGRKRKEDNGEGMGSHFSDNNNAPQGRSAIARIVTIGHSEPFDLKANSFPPLPSYENCSKDESDDDNGAEEMVSNGSSLAEVVKGTVKQSAYRYKSESSDTNVCFTSDGSKSESLAASVHINSFSQKLSKDMKMNCNNDNKNKEDLNSCLNQTSHDFDHSITNANLSIPAKSLNHSQPTSSSGLSYELSSSESSQETESKPSLNTPVLNGINDSFSTNSDSIENNSHSSATQTQPSSPNSQISTQFKSLNVFNPHELQCNGRSDVSTDECASLNGESIDKSDSSIISDQNCSKKLSYSDIARRAKDIQNQNQEQHQQQQSVPKDKESISSNSSTSSKTSAHFPSNSGRSKFKTTNDHKVRGVDIHSNRSFYLNKDMRHTHDVHDKKIISRVK